MYFFILKSIARKSHILLPMDSETQVCFFLYLPMPYIPFVNIFRVMLRNLKNCFLDQILKQVVFFN